MLKALLLSLTAALAAMATAQNLVPNGGFEDPMSCVGTPWSYSLELAVPWFSPNAATPDLYTTEAISGCGTLLVPDDPNNPGLYRDPFEGYRFAGFYAFNEGDSLKEYCSVPLTASLTPGHTYRIRARYLAYSVFQYAVDRLGALVTADPISIEGWGMIHLEPQVTFLGNPYLDHTEEWGLMEGEFVALGDEAFLTIGSFVPNEQVSTVQISEFGVTSAYYLLDAVELVDVSVGIEEHELVLSPIHGGVQIGWHGHGRLENVAIYDAAGRMVSLLGDIPPGTSMNYPLFLPSGVYVVRAMTNGWPVHGRFVGG